VVCLVTRRDVQHFFKLPNTTADRTPEPFNCPSNQAINESIILLHKIDLRLGDIYLPNI
jgi:hypothetical protein